MAVVPRNLKWSIESVQAGGRVVSVLQIHSSYSETPLLGAEMSAASDSRVENPIVVAELDGHILRVKPVGPNVGQREGPIIDRDVKPLLAAAGKDLKALILDLNDVTFMSSMGLGTCIALRNEANAAGAKTAIIGLGSELESLFKMMRIHKLYEIQKNDKALASWLAKL